jgi:hypothetical protein
MIERKPFQRIRVATLLKMPLHVRLASGAFPKAQLVLFQDISEILKGVCLGATAAAFLARISHRGSGKKPLLLA